MRLEAQEVVKDPESLLAVTATAGGAFLFGMSVESLLSIGTSMLGLIAAVLGCILLILRIKIARQELKTKE